VGAVGEEHVDQPAGAAGVALRRAGGVPVGLVGGGEHPEPAGLDQGRRTGQGTRLGLQDLQVVIQGQDVEELADCPLVAGDGGGSVEDLDGGRAEPNGQAAPSEAGRDRVGALAHRHPRLRIDPGQQQPGGVERLTR